MTQDYFDMDDEDIEKLSVKEVHLTIRRDDTQVESPIGDNGRYSDTEKALAIQYMITHRVGFPDGLTYAFTERSLGIPAITLSKWLKDYKSTAKSANETAENIIANKILGAELAIDAVLQKALEVAAGRLNTGTISNRELVSLISALGSQRIGLHNARESNAVKREQIEADEASDDKSVVAQILQGTGDLASLVHAAKARSVIIDQDQE